MKEDREDVPIHKIYISCLLFCLSILTVEGGDVEYLTIQLRALACFTQLGGAEL